MNSQRSKLTHELEQSGATATEAARLADLADQLRLTAQLERSTDVKQRRLRALISQPVRRRFLWPRLGLALAVSLLFVTVTLAAAEQSQPGEPLYPVKRWSEGVRAMVDLQFAGQLIVRRSSEVKELIEEQSDSSALAPALHEVEIEAHRTQPETPPAEAYQKSLENLEAAQLHSSDKERDQLKGTIEKVKQRTEPEDKKDKEKDKKDD